MNYSAFPYQGTKLPDAQWAQGADSTASEDGSYEEASQKEEERGNAVAGGDTAELQPQLDAQATTVPQSGAAAQGRKHGSKHTKRNQQRADEMANIDALIAEFKVSDQQSPESALQNRRHTLQTQIAERERQLERVRRRKPGQVQAMETLVKSKKAELRQVEQEIARLTAREPVTAQRKVASEGEDAKQND